MATPSTEMTKEEFDAAYPVGSERRREELAVNPRPQDEETPQSGADFDQAEIDEFLAWKHARDEEANA